MQTQLSAVGTRTEVLDALAPQVRRAAGTDGNAAHVLDAVLDYVDAKHYQAGDTAVVSISIAIEIRPASAPATEADG